MMLAKKVKSLISLEQAEGKETLRYTELLNNKSQSSINANI